MKTTFGLTWSRRVAPVVLGACIAAGALLLLGLALELQDPVWTRPAIVLQLLAIALASAALRAQWPLSRRFVVYPLILVVVTYLWDTTLPPPSLPEGLLRGVAPRLALLGLVIDLTIWQGRQRGALAQAARWSDAFARRIWAAISAGRRIPVRQGLVPLDEVVQHFHISAEALRARLERVGGVSVWDDGREHIRLDDLIQIVAQWNEQQAEGNARRTGERPTHPPTSASLRRWQVYHYRANGRVPNGTGTLPGMAFQPAEPARNIRRPQRSEQIDGGAPTVHTELSRRLRFTFGAVWLVLTTIVTIPPGIEMNLIADGHAPSAAIFACLQPWVGWVIGSAALLDFLTLFIAIWVIPALRLIATLAIVGGTLSGIGLGMLIGVPCL